MRLRALRRRAPCTPGERRGAPGEAGRDHGGHPAEGASRGRGPSSVRRLPQALRLGPEARVVVPSLGHRHPQQPVGGNALPRWAAGALGPIPAELSLAAGRRWRVRGARGGQSRDGDSRLRRRLSPPGLRGVASGLDVPYGPLPS